MSRSRPSVVAEPTLDEYPWRPTDLSRWYGLPQDFRQEVAHARLRRAWRQAWANIPYYRRVWERNGLMVGDLAGCDDLRKLPTTGIEDFRSSMETYPPFGDVIDESLRASISAILTSGGTTGAPRPVPISRQAQRAAAQLAARSLAFAGVTNRDVVQVTSTFSTHGAAWIAAWGCELLGAMLVPTSSGAVTRSRHQVELMRFFGSTVLRCSPSYARILAATATELGVDPKDLGVRLVITAGEVISPLFRRSLEETWGAKVHDLYGTMETLCWSSIDCAASQQDSGARGMHIWDDAIVVEVLRPDGSVCDDGEYGELTLTSWICDIGPKFRYRMGDRVAVVSDPCPCGIPTKRLLPLAGRLDDCLRVRGTNIWPSALEDAVRRSLPGCDDYVLIADRVDGRDRLRLLVTATAPGTLGEDALQDARDRLKAMLAVTVELEVASSARVAEMNGAGSNRKTRRIVDLRGR